MAGWLHGVFVGEWIFVLPLCGFSLSLFCSYVRTSPQQVRRLYSHQILTSARHGEGGRSDKRIALGDVGRHREPASHTAYRRSMCPSGVQTM